MYFVNLGVKGLLMAWHRSIMMPTSAAYRFFLDLLLGLLSGRFNIPNWRSKFNLQRNILDAWNC